MDEHSDRPGEPIAGPVEPASEQRTEPMATTPEPFPLGGDSRRYEMVQQDEPRRGPSLGTVILTAIVVSLIVGTLAGGVAGYAGIWLASAPSNGGGLQNIRVVPSETDQPIVAAAGAAVPSVVNIDVSGEAPTEDDSGLPGGHPDVPRQGNGSGVAFKQVEGGGTYIITNAHVVEDADTFVVKDANDERHDAELVGADPDTDIAVLKIDADIPVIEVGSSDDLSVGETVVAIGSPFGLEHSVSAGVVSALGRSLPEFADSPPGTYPLIDVIQTDAAINPGNSGGALVDNQGRLVGINTAIYSDTGASGGIGFAIPVSTAARVADQLVADGKVEHPFLGILGRDVDQALKAEMDLPVDEGAYVVEVTEETEAEKAGVKAGDVIVALDDADIRSMDDLILQVRRHKVGDSVTLRLFRDGEEMELEMKVGEKPENVEVPESTPTP